MTSTADFITALDMKMRGLKTDILQAIMDDGVQLPPIKEREENGARIYESMTERELLDALIVGMRQKIQAAQDDATHAYRQCALLEGELLRMNQR